jgi:adenylate cyclase
MATQEQHTFLFADLCDYSVLSEQAGDEVAAEVAIGFSTKVATMAAEHGVELVRRIGDAVMVHCECASSLMAFGMRLMEEISGKDGTPQVHAGIHTGPALARGGDWWGSTVNVAARV